MSLPLQTRSYTTDLYTQALSSIWSFYDRVRDPSYALAQDVDVWEVIRRDPKIYQGTTERLHAVAGPDWRVFPFNNSKDRRDMLLAKVAEDALRRIPHFADARLRLAQCVFRGQATELIVGKRQRISLGGLPAMDWWVPTGLKNIDHRRFTIRPVRSTDEKGIERVRGELYISTVPMQGPGHKERPTAGPRPDSTPSSGFLTYYRKVEHPEWFVRTVYNDEEARLGYGHGANDALYFYSWIKSVLLREGLQGVERWSQGIVHGKIDENRVGNTEQTMDHERAAMLDTLTKMRSRGVIVTGKLDEVEIHTGGGEGHQIVMGLLDYVDDCIMAVCTGAILMSSKSNAGSSGSLARDLAGQVTQKGVITFDKNKMDEDLSIDLIGLFLRSNRANLVKLGLHGAGRPQFRTIGAKTKDPDKFASRLGAITQASPDGFKMRKDELFEGMDLTPPGEDDEVVIIGGPGQIGRAQAQMQLEAQAAQLEMDKQGQEYEQEMGQRKLADESQARQLDRDSKEEEKPVAASANVPIKFSKENTSPGLPAPKKLPAPDEKDWSEEIAHRRKLVSDYHASIRDMLTQAGGKPPEDHVVRTIGGRMAGVYAPKGGLPELPPLEHEKPGLVGGRHIGKCFDMAGRYSVLDNDYNHERKLVHGVLGLNPPIAHGWVELPGNRVFDGTHQAFYDKDAYYKAFHAVPEKAYSVEQARGMMLKHKHFGPWHDTSGLYHSFEDQKKSRRRGHRFAAVEAPPIPKAARPRRPGEPSFRHDYGPGLPTDTLKHHTVDGTHDGPLTPERQALHDRIVHEAHGHVPSVPAHKTPVAILTMGAGGAGKSTIIGKIPRLKERFAVADPDEMKFKIPEFHAHVKAGARYAGGAVHEESSRIAKRVRDEAIAQRKHLVIDGSGHDAEKYLGIVKHLKSKGYRVALIGAHADLETHRRRIDERAGRIGRWVPDEHLEGIHPKITPNFHRVGREADVAVLYNTKDRPPGTKPPTIAKYSGGKLVHHTPVSFRSFSRSQPAKGRGRRADRGGPGRRRK